jgi:hypothetical protein
VAAEGGEEDPKKEQAKHKRTSLSEPDGSVPFKTSQITVSLPPLFLSNDLQRPLRLDLVWVLLRCFSAARSNPAPAAHQADGPEQAPFNHQRVEPRS